MLLGEWAAFNLCFSLKLLRISPQQHYASTGISGKGENIQVFDGFWDLAQDICKSVTCDDSQSVLCVIHLCLGLVNAGTNNHIASRRHKEAFLALQISICESVGPGYVDQHLGSAYTEMAMAYSYDGSLDEAVSAYRRAG